MYFIYLYEIYQINEVFSCFLKYTFQLWYLYLNCVFYYFQCKYSLEALFKGFNCSKFFIMWGLWPFSYAATANLNFIYLYVSESLSVFFSEILLFKHF